MIPGVTISDKPAVIRNGRPESGDAGASGREKTLAYRILRKHEKRSFDGKLHIGFDALVSHDITYVGIIQTARASGLESFPIPYAMTNCHNSLCAVGGTINADDHAFGLSAAKKYGGIYVPPHLAVIHQYAREKLTGCGKMILGSDSHTRYGCFGTMGVGEGGGELAKQLLKNTWDADEPPVILVWLEGKPRRGIGPHDVAIALVGMTFPKGFAKNCILEFAGPGIAELSMDYRVGIDVMTTETGCLSSIWETDGTVARYYDMIGRPEGYSELSVEEGAGYDKTVFINLDEIEAMIALPFHPSKALTVRELQANPREILAQTEQECAAELNGNLKPNLLSCIGQDGKVHCEQGIIAGCSGGMYENLAEAAAILNGKNTGDGFFELSVYPSSAPVNRAIMTDGTMQKLSDSGAVVKTCFCGPCFGAGDTPANNAFSIRHVTRNFANREGSKPAKGQIAAVALMDARSIAATAANGGILTAATDVEYDVPEFSFEYNDCAYDRVYEGFGRPQPETELRFGPNIADWPKMESLKENLLVKLCAVIHDPVTTTDELIPSGETSSYRSNPAALAEFALSRRVPEYVGRCKAVKDSPELPEMFQLAGAKPENTTVGSCLFAEKPGDGSAREQAASCQKVLGGFANISYEYATKRYRSNCINWGIIPFTTNSQTPFDGQSGDWVFVPGVRSGILEGQEKFKAFLLHGGEKSELELDCKKLSEEERQILVKGCLINYYAG